MSVRSRRYRYVIYVHVDTKDYNLDEDVSPSDFGFDLGGERHTDSEEMRVGLGYLNS